MSDTAVRAARPAARTHAVHTAWVRRRDRRGFGFIAPFLIGFVLFVIAPLGYAAYSSLYTSRIIGGTVFAGADNYT
ncbi:MAG TPA: sugar ABC transporter permease, partial [Actinoallomurus sp.]|nr:sugar ABC transporter permease [Actinoallomurus sp.]